MASKPSVDLSFRSPTRGNSIGPEFNVTLFLDSAGPARQIVEFCRSEKIYSQGEPTRGVKYVRTGGVKLSVVNASGKERVLALLEPGDFFGEGCLVDQPVCMESAIAVVPTSILYIEKNEMKHTLQTEHTFSKRFLTHMLERNIRMKEDLIDQLFNSSEKRLARALLLLARYGEASRHREVLPRVSQETLAEMIGTTRSRVNCFMNKFKKLGYIRYDGGVRIEPSLLNIVLND
jgi:CRP/FNR family transcriptional regulator, cyclic AMP receptor protein